MSRIRLEKIKPSDSIADESVTALSNQTKVCSTTVMQEVSASKLAERIQDDRYFTKAKDLTRERKIAIEREKNRNLAVEIAR